MATHVFRSILLQSIRFASAIARPSTGSQGDDRQELDDDDHEDAGVGRSLQRSPSAELSDGDAAETPHVAVSIIGSGSLGSETSSGRSRLADVAKVRTSICSSSERLKRTAALSLSRCTQASSPHMLGTSGGPREQQAVDCLLLACTAQDVVLRIECYDRKRWSYGTLVRTLLQSRFPTSLCRGILCITPTARGVLTSARDCSPSHIICSPSNHPCLVPHDQTGV